MTESGPAATLPVISEGTAPFWQGGREGRLMIMHCADCARWFHPPSPLCPHCHSRAVAFRPASGTGVIEALTLRYDRGPDGARPGALIAVVGLPEPGDVRLVTRIVDCPPGRARIGARVSVRFEAVADVHLPCFTVVDMEGEA